MPILVGMRSLTADVPLERSSHRPLRIPFRRARTLLFTALFVCSTAESVEAEVPPTAPPRVLLVVQGSHHAALESMLLPALARAHARVVVAPRGSLASTREAIRALSAQYDVRLVVRIRTFVRKKMLVGVRVFSSDGKWIKKFSWPVEGSLRETRLPRSVASSLRRVIAALPPAEPAPERLDENESGAEPSVEAPPVEAPPVEAPTVEAPAVEAPVVEAPPVEAPVVEAPTVVPPPPPAPAEEPKPGPEPEWDSFASHQKLEVFTGIRAFSRQLSYLDGAMGSRQVHALQIAPAFFADLEWFPGAHFDAGVFAHIGVSLAYERSIGVSLETAQGTSLACALSRLSAGIRIRIPLPVVELGLTAHYLSHEFAIAPGTPDAPRPSIPNVAYGGVRAGALANFTLASWLVIGIEGGYQWVFSSGEVASAAFLPKVQVFAFDVGAALIIPLPRDFDVRFGGNLRFFSLDRNSLSSDPEMASRARDLYLAVNVAFGFHLH